MASSSIERLDGMMQRVYAGDSRYVLVSKVQFGSLWTIEIGSIGEPQPRWWRSVLDAENIPKSLTPETIAAAIVEGELHLSGLSGSADTSPKLKFYPSRVDSGSIHLMSYSAEESAQRAEKIIFEFASRAQKSGCRIFSVSPNSAPNAMIAPIDQPSTLQPALSISSEPPLAPSSDAGNVEIEKLKEKLLKSETTIRNLKDQVIHHGPGMAQSRGQDQPLASNFARDKPRGGATHRKRVVEAVEFESDAEITGKPHAISTINLPGRSNPMPSEGLMGHRAKGAMSQPRKRRVLAKNEFESDDE